jgi:hypothetical protein
MKASVFADEEQLITKAVEVLIKALGPVDAVRFLTLPKKKRMESVKRHQQWQAQLQQGEFFDHVFGRRSS